MRACRPQWGALAIAALLALGLVSPIARAQDTLPQNVYSAQKPLTNEQQQAIESYVTHWVDKLCNGQNADISQARGKLKDPLTLPGTTPDFAESYSTVLIKKLNDCAKAQRLIVRLNTMYVATFVKQGANPINLIQIGVSDPSPGVRYWAAKAMASLAGRDDLNIQDQKQILEMLQQALAKESDATVLAELLKALNALDLPAAKNVLLSVLTQRVVVYKKNPQALFKPISAPLQELYIDLITRKAAGEQVDDQIREIARVAFLYMSLAAEQLDQAPALSAELQDDKAAMISQCDTILRYALSALAEGARKPEEIRNALSRKDWKFILVQVDRWRTILLRPPFGFNEEELTIPDPEEDENEDAARAAEANDAE